MAWIDHFMGVTCEVFLIEEKKIGKLLAVVQADKISNYTTYYTH